jgi:hypothetical protein
MRLISIACLFLSSVLPSQNIRVINNSNALYDGWLRVNINTPPPASAGWELWTYPVSQGSTPDYRDASVIYVLASSPANYDGYAIDLKVKIGPGVVRDIDLANLTPISRAVPQVPNDFGIRFQGMPTINGKMMWLSTTALGILNIPGQICDGAAITPIVSIDTGDFDIYLKIPYYPDQPGWCHATAYIYAKKTQLLNYSLNLAWANAMVMPLNNIQGRLLNSNYFVTQGQTIEVSLTFVWPQYLSNFHGPSATADITYSVIAREI